MRIGYSIPAIALLLLLGTLVTLGQCPSINVVGPPGMTMPGDSIVFRIESAPPGFRYKWSVEMGTITEGQGTPVITVATDKKRDDGITVTATVEVVGLPADCPKTASETAPVLAKPIGEPVDDFSYRTMINDDVRSRLDNYFAALSDNPSGTGLIVLRIPGKERTRNRHVRLILDHIKWRKFELKRIWFGFETFFDPRTTLWIVPPGALDDLPCDKCTIIKGVDVENRRR